MTAEPPNLGAVVEDRAGCRWVRASPAQSGATQCWLNDMAHPGAEWRAWPEVEAIRVLAPGVPTA